LRGGARRRGNLVAAASGIEIASLPLAMTAKTGAAHQHRLCFSLEHTRAILSG